MASSIKFLKKLTKRGNKSTDQLRSPSPAVGSASTSVEGAIGEIGRSASGKQDSSPGGNRATEAVREGSNETVSLLIVAPNTRAVAEFDGPIAGVEVPTESAEDDRPKTRVELAHEALLQASDELVKTLEDYINSSQASDYNGNVPSAHFKLSFSSGLMTPENFGAAIEQVLLKQKNQKPTIASKVGNAIGKIYPLASLTLGLAAYATESATLAPVKGAANSLSLLLQIADQEQSRGEDFLKQLDRIQYQALRVAEVQKHNDLEVSELLLEKSTNLMTAVILFLKDSIMFFRHDYFYNLGKTVLLGPKIYSDARAALELAIAEYDQALLLQVTIKVLAMRTGIPPPQPDPKFQQSELAAWLKSSYWDVDAQFLNNCELRAPGTLQWVLEAEEFRRWRLTDSESLWLNGLPGVGKSIITAYLIQVLKAQHPDAVVLYFFCKAGDSTLDNVDRLIRTLAMQLALAAPEAREKLQALKEEGFQTEKADAYAFSRLIRDTITVVSRPIFVVIDGLDECFGGEAGVDNAIETLLDGLQKLEVKLLVSSRPTPEITQAMGRCPKRPLTFEDSRDDIKLYVAMRVNKSKGLQKGFARINKDASDFLSEKSQGNFLWVSIVLNLLDRTPSVKAFQKAIETLPKGIAGVYDRVLDKLVTAETFEMASAILVCVLFSVRPMTIAELQVAVGLLVDEVLDLQEFVESNCGSFLGIVPGKDGPNVHIVHETFRSYITDPTVSKERCLPPSRSHMRLAAACLGCLIKFDDDDVTDFRRYSTRHWFQHFNDSRESETDIVVLQAMLVKINVFVSHPEAVKKWMKDFTFELKGSVEYWSIGSFMSDVHHGIYDWLQSDILKKLAESDDNESGEDLEEALRWRIKVLGEDLFLARVIVGKLTFIWLNTNWKEVLMSKMAFTQALATAHILQLVGPKENAHYTELNPLLASSGISIPKIPDSAKAKPGWTWRHSASYSAHWNDLNEERIKSLAALGAYNCSVGLQSGNYAIAALVVKLKNCVRAFQAAIDEHPMYWHFHEALGDWYYRINEKEKAVLCYWEAMKFDPKKPASCAIDYWSLVSQLKKSEGDIEGAVEALRTGVSLVPEKDSWIYWKRIADIYRELKDWENLKYLYREAIEKTPNHCKDYWRELASTYDRTLDWVGKMETYFGAIMRDPENTEKYAQDLRSMARDFKDLQLLEPALLILQNGINRHPDEADKYKKEMADCYMGARKWRTAADLYESIRSGPNAHDREFAYLNYDLGHAYLGLGDTTRALAAYQEKRMERLTAGDISGNSGDAAYVHMIDGDFNIAISQIKADITGNLKYYPNGPQDWYKASEFLETHGNLGVCYEAIGRMEEARASFQSAADMFAKFIPKLEPFVHTDNNTPYHRSTARTLLEYGLILENVGRIEEARRIYEGATHRYERTTFVGDDEPLQWENEQVTLALQRVNSLEPRPDMPSLLEEIGGPRLELRLCLRYRTNWYAYEHWRAPRFRQGRSGYPAMMLKDTVSH